MRTKLSLLVVSLLVLPSLLVAADALAQGEQTRAPEAPQISDAEMAQMIQDNLDAWANQGTQGKAATIRVNAMPPTFGADVGAPQAASWIGKDNIIFGNVTAGTPPYTYNISFGDGSPNVNGVVADARYIRARHAYATQGPKVITLTVTDADGDSDSETTRIDVGPYDIGTRVQAAIEDGLRYLYLSQNPAGYWYNGAGDALCALAMQLRGHDMGNDPDEDIYAESLRAYWYHIFNRSNNYGIGPEAAGNPDTNGNGIGIYQTSYDSGYNHGINMLAMAGITDLSEVITSGPQAGRTIADVLQDMVDLATYAQTNGGAQRGGWRYSIRTSNSGSDNSAVQWIVLGMIAADGRGLTVPAHVQTELELWTLYSQYDPDGGFGYTAPTQWRNIAKTGAGMIQLGWLGYDIADLESVGGISFMNSRWSATTDMNGYREQFNGNYYSMYAVKKGMEEFAPDGDLIGAHDWQDEYNKVLVDDPSSGYDAVGAPNNTDPMEQDLNPNDLLEGRWNGGVWLASYVQTRTATAVLILTEGITTLVPVADCLVSPPQAGPGDVITLDGTGSFHQDPQNEIASYAWDYDDADGVDFVTPDGTGPIVQTTYDLDPGELNRDFNITLRVTDLDGVERDSRCVVRISRENNPPVAVPGGPYSSCVGEEICVDGSGSYDPDESDGDFIAAYRWDLDGDSEFDDFDGPATCVTFSGLYDGVVALQVEDSFGEVSQNADAIVRIFTALGDLNTEDADLVLDVDDLCAAGTDVCVTGSYRVLSDDPDYVVAEARVDFYLDNPLDPGSRFASFIDVNLTDGDVVTHDLCFVRPDDQNHTIYMIVDPLEAVNECVETDNVAVLELPCDECESLDDIDLVLVDYETVDWDPITLIWTVRVSVRNDGSATAYSVSSQLQEDIDWVTPVVGMSSYGNVAPGATTLGTPFVLDLTGRPGPGGFNVFFIVNYENDCGDQGRVILDPEANLPTDTAVAKRYALNQNHPNPFNPQTTITFTLARDGHTNLSVYDVRGRLVSTLVDKELGAGVEQRFVWDGTDTAGRTVSSGLYYYRLVSGEYVQTKKMTLLK